MRLVVIWRFHIFYSYLPFALLNDVFKTQTFLIFPADVFNIPYLQHFQNPNETLYRNYHAYLCDARFEIVSRTIACAYWSSKYDNIPPKPETNNNSTREIKEADTPPNSKEQDSLVSLSTSGYCTLKNSDTSEKEPHSLNSLIEVADTGKEANQQCTSDSKHDSLTSIGESSGYDSLYRVDDNEDEGFAEESFRKSFVKGDVGECDEVPCLNWRASADTLIGEFNLQIHHAFNATKFLFFRYELRKVTKYNCYNSYLALPYVIEYIGIFSSINSAKKYYSYNK